MKLWIVFRLSGNFLRGLLLSGWDTARIIMRRRSRTTAGLVSLHYTGLSEAQAALVGALITLAPGTSTVDIDHARGVFTLHLLDASKSNEILADIEQDFIRPLQMFNGEWS